MISKLIFFIPIIIIGSSSIWNLIRSTIDNDSMKTVHGSLLGFCTIMEIIAMMCAHFWLHDLQIKFSLSKLIVSGAPGIIVWMMWVAPIILSLADSILRGKEKLS